MRTRATSVRPGTAYCGFAVFGVFWGAWGASIPAIRDQAGLTDGELGTALLFIGLGALPAMLTAGRAVDRWGHRVSAVLLVVLAGAGVAVAATAHGLVSMSVGLAVLGASSGAADVAINAAAGSAERASGRPVITRSHGVFSAAVVVASLSSGLVTAASAPVVTPFLLITFVAVVASRFIAAHGGGDGPSRHPARTLSRPRPSARLPALLVIGVLAALGFAVENAHQSWSAVYLAEVLHTGPAVAAAGPAVFAAVVAVTRLAVGALEPGRPTLVVITGAAIAAVGTAVVSVAPAPATALLGLGLAAAGTAVLFPTLLSLVAAHVEEAARGAATSIVTTVAYLGFLAGPVYVGRWAQALGLSGAMLAVAALAAALALLAWPALRAMAKEPDPVSVGSVESQG